MNSLFGTSRKPVSKPVSSTNQESQKVADIYQFHPLNYTNVPAYPMHPRYRHCLSDDPSSVPRESNELIDSSTLNRNLIKPSAFSKPTSMHWSDTSHSTVPVQGSDAKTSTRLPTAAHQMHPCPPLYHATDPRIFDPIRTSKSSQSSSTASGWLDRTMNDPFKASAIVSTLPPPPLTLGHAPVMRPQPFTDSSSSTLPPHPPSPIQRSASLSITTTTSSSSHSFPIQTSRINQQSTETMTSHVNTAVSGPLPPNWHATLHQNYPHINRSEQNEAFHLSHPPQRNPSGLCHHSPGHLKTNQTQQIPPLPSATTPVQVQEPASNPEIDVTQAQTDSTSEDTPLSQWNMRHTNVLHLPKFSHRKNSGFERRLKHTGLVLDPKLTLRLLRKVLQPFINKAVNKVMQHYMEEYVLIAVRNIRDNLGEESVTEEDLIGLRQSIMRRVALQYFVRREHMPYSHSEKEPSTSFDPDVTSKLKIPQAIFPSSLPPHPNESQKIRPATSHPPPPPPPSSCAIHRIGDLTSNDCVENVQCILPSSSCPKLPVPPNGIIKPMANTLEQSNRFLPLPVTTAYEHPVSVAGDPFLGAGTTTFDPMNGPDSANSSCSTVGFFRDLSSPESSPSLVHAINLPSCSNVSSSANSVTQQTTPASNSAALLTANRRSRRVVKKRLSPWWNWGSRRWVNRIGCRVSQKKMRYSRVEPWGSGVVPRVPPLDGIRSSDTEQDSTNEVCSVDEKSVSDTTTALADLKRKNGFLLPFPLNKQTVFALGSSANTWLGMGAARGRIYTKHPELFRYLCDAEDKAWLVHQGLLTGQGVKAYLMNWNQVRLVAHQHKRPSSTESFENNDSSDDLPKFTVPPWLLSKIEAMFNYRKVPPCELQSASTTTTSTSTAHAAHGNTRLAASVITTTDLTSSAGASSASTLSEPRTSSRSSIASVEHVAHSDVEHMVVNERVDGPRETETMDSTTNNNSRTRAGQPFHPPQQGGKRVLPDPQRHRQTPEKRPSPDNQSKCATIPSDPSCPVGAKLSIRTSSPSPIPPILQRFDYS